jgi:MFS family permease
MTSGGLVLASGAFALVAAFTTDAEFAAWGWRVPFLASAVFLAFALCFRYHLSETPAFIAELEAKEIPKVPFLQVFRERSGIFSWVSSRCPASMPLAPLSMSSPLVSSSPPWACPLTWQLLAWWPPPSPA